MIRSSTKTTKVISNHLESTLINSTCKERYQNVTSNKDRTRLYSNLYKQLQIVQTSKEGIQNVSNLIEQLSKRSKQTKKGQTIVVPDGYYSIEQTSKVLHLSVYRTRQLQWENVINNDFMIKRDRRIYYKIEEIERVKKQRDQSKVERTDLDLTRFCKRVIRSSETIRYLIENDSTISKQLKQQFLDLIRKFEKESVEIIQESNTTK